MPDDDIHRIPINELDQESGAHELATSPDMESYLDLLKMLAGAEESQRMMVQAIGTAEQNG